MVGVVLNLKVKMDVQKIIIEYINDENVKELKRIQRDDVSVTFVDTVDTILEITKYGVEHGCIGHTYVVKYDDQYIGIVLLGEALEWETDPAEMKERPFYRLMGFIIDKRYRGSGIGSYVLEEIISQCYSEFGVRPIVLGVHKDNHKAEKFYVNHGFRKTNAMEGNDYYFIRYPE